MAAVGGAGSGKDTGAEDNGESLSQDWDEERNSHGHLSMTQTFAVEIYHKTWVCVNISFIYDKRME